MANSGIWQKLWAMPAKIRKTPAPIGLGMKTYIGTIVHQTSTAPMKV